MARALPALEERSAQVVRTAKSHGGLPALEKNGACAACPGGGLLRLSPAAACLPWRRVVRALPALEKILCA